MQNDEDLKKIGSKIKKLRKEKNYTSHENFAFEHEISSSFYWSVENGRNMRLDYFLTLLKKLETNPKDFFEDWE
ncbi:MAG: helix-turn-helix transcriptional regulator [Bacteroidota bacterium]|nr:helix-turn-helix transcriptional regulator [Bacteroidota bacterium]